MLGLADGWVVAAYVLCLLSTLLCVLYGLIFWNRGQEQTDEDDRKWARQEDQLTEKL